jgi:hypothetical protein
MNRLSTFVWIFVIVVAAFMLYKVKYQVQALKTEIAETSRELERKREALHVVAAEWAYLNRPERLQKLANKYLASTDLTVDQIAEIEAIPFTRQTFAAVESEDGFKPVSATMRKDGAAVR